MGCWRRGPVGIVRTGGQKKPTNPESNVPGIVEQVTFVLAPGWKLGSPAEGVKTLLKRMKMAAKEKGVPVKTVEEQLVVVLVHKAEDVVSLVCDYWIVWVFACFLEWPGKFVCAPSQHDNFASLMQLRTFLKYPSFIQFLSALFDQKYLLVPVLINAERCSDEDLNFAKGQLEAHLVSLSKEHGDWMQIWYLFIVSATIFLTQ